jgi:hypothetical protein
MQGADSITTLQAIAGRIESPIEYVDLERALDEVEYLYQRQDPELSHLADGLIQTLRHRQAECAGHA